MRNLIAGFLALALPTISTADEKLFDIVKSGTTQSIADGYLSFEGCDFDKRYELSTLIFECASFDYDYEYGTAIIIGNQSSRGGPVSYYLCTDEGECYPGRVFRKK